MAFLESGDEVTDPEVAALYARDRYDGGLVPNYTRTFSLRPSVYLAWEALNEAIKANADRRHYRIATVAAARRLRSSYCALAHGEVLATQIADQPTVRAIVGGAWDGLDPVDAAVARLADRVVRDAPSMTPADLAELRSLGFDDARIFDVIVTAAARCFFSTVLDATGTLPDPDIAGRLDEETRRALTVGRPIATT